MGRRSGHPRGLVWILQLGLKKGSKVIYISEPLPQLSRPSPSIFSLHSILFLYSLSVVRSVHIFLPLRFNFHMLLTLHDVVLVGLSASKVFNFLFLFLIFLIFCFCYQFFILFCAWNLNLRLVAKKAGQRKQKKKKFVSCFLVDFAGWFCFPIKFPGSYKDFPPKQAEPAFSYPAKTVVGFPLSFIIMKA